MELLTTVGETMTYTDSSVINGQSYRYQVSAVNARGEGAASAEASATPFTVPGEPQNVVVTGGNARATISWNAPSTGGAVIDNYVIYRDGGEVGRTTATTYIDTGLTNGQTYTYHVRAINAAGTGPQSESVAVIPRSNNIVITNPSADATWTKGTSYSIGWTSNLVDSVRIDLVRGSDVVMTIADTTVNDGT
jgi:fibronectin type 3 domain-containing protein